MGGLSVVGRERESGLLVRLLGEVNDRGSSLVLTGIAGIGKSTLLQDARRIAGDRDMFVLATAGVRPEANLPFAGLHRLRRAVPQVARASGDAPRRRNAGRLVRGAVAGASSAATARSATAASVVRQAGSSRSCCSWPRDGRVRIRPCLADLA